MPRDKRGYFSGLVLVPAARGANELRRTYSEPLLIVMAIVGRCASHWVRECCQPAAGPRRRPGRTRSRSGSRSALAAADLIRQLLTEGVVLVSLGAAAGLLFARWGASFLVAVLAGPD